MAGDGSLQTALAVWGFHQAEPVKEPAGIFYETRLVRHKLSLKQDTRPVFRCKEQEAAREAEAQANGTSNGAVEEEKEEVVEDRVHLFDEDGPKYEKYLFKLDPGNTKEQDHYKVLGISKLRYDATVNEIRVAYRAKVLKHHPDKKKHKGVPLPNGEDYYVCITKAYEQLGMSKEKRRAFDSVDPKFNDEIPTEKEVKKGDFFETLTPVFEKNARWSVVQPVPLLGHAESTREEVEAFYNFWFEWKTWREFSYLDEEDKEKGEDRWERREMDKQNKVERARRSKDESKRIRTLIDLAYNRDPRIIKFKKEEAAEKERAKEDRRKARNAEAEAAKAAAKAAEEAAAKAAEEAAVKAKADKEAAKKEREALKKLVQAARRKFKNMAAENGYWVPEDQLLVQMERVDKVCSALSLDLMNELCDLVESLSVNEEIHEAIDNAQAPKRKAPAKNGAAAPIAAPVVEKKVESAAPVVVVAEDKGKENTAAANGPVQWTQEELHLLLKASQQFPVGTVDRWVKIADFVNEHRKDKSTPPKKEKEIIKQVKAVQLMQLKPAASTASQSSYGQDVASAAAGAAPTEAAEDEWSAAEQKSLEEALRKFPASDAERWDKISAAVGSKNKKACMRRFKYLAQMVKNAKK